MRLFRWMGPLLNQTPLPSTTRPPPAAAACVDGGADGRQRVRAPVGDAAAPGDVEHARRGMRGRSIAATIASMRVQSTEGSAAKAPATVAAHALQTRIAFFMPHANARRSLGRYWEGGPP